jgi:hypothetical protein
MTAPSAEPCQPLIATDRERLVHALQAVARDGAAAVPVLTGPARRTLARATGQLDFRTARTQVGEGPKAVTQTFEIVDHVPAEGPLGQAAAELAAALNDARQDPACPPCPQVVFNDRVVQRYPPCPVGISPHRDHLRYVNLVVNIVLEGFGRFYICPERSFAGAREIPGTVGDAVIMRAPGFADSDRRPFHAIGEVTRERLVVGLRQDSRADDG